MTVPITECQNQMNDGSRAIVSRLAQILLDTLAGIAALCGVTASVGAIIFAWSFLIGAI